MRGRMPISRSSERPLVLWRKPAVRLERRERVNDAVSMTWTYDTNRRRRTGMRGLIGIRPWLVGIPSGAAFAVAAVVLVKLVGGG